MNKLKRPVSSKWLHTINEDTKLSFVARAVSVSVFSLCKPGYCFASNASLAKRLGCSSVTISRAVSELQRHGYVQVDIDKSRGNWRRIIPAFPHVKSEDTPIIVDDVTSDVRSTNAHVSTDHRTASIATNGVGTSDDNNKKKEPEEHNKMKEQKNDDVGVDLGNDELENEISELEDFDEFRLLPFRDLAKSERVLLLKKWRKILLGERRLHELSENDQILVLMSLYSLLGKTVYDYRYGENLLRQAFASGKTAEAIFTAMWRLHHSTFAVDREKWRNGWNLEYICSEEKGIDWIHNNYPMNAPSEDLEEKIQSTFELIVSPDRWPRDYHVAKHSNGRLERM